MRVILDTNVLMSAVFFGGTPGQLLSAWASGKFTMILSPEILDEYRRVGYELTQRYAHLEDGLEPLLALIAMNATIVDAQPLEYPVCEDADDDKFLACALASQADTVVSGDKHLLRLSGWQKIEILTPRQFHDRYLKKRKQ